MRAELVRPEDVSTFIESATYRVLLWNKPQHEGESWALDEWQIDEASDVFEVIDWARAQRATTFEVVVVSAFHSLDAGGNTVIEYEYARVAGSPGDGSSTVQVVTFTSPG